jgi:L-lactate dehydrogenase complex protein LldG
MNPDNPVLARIREALRVPAPVPGHHDDHDAIARLRSPDEFSHWLPAVGPGLDSQLELFARNSADLKTEFHLVPDLEAARRKLSEVACASGWARVATHSDGLTDALVPGLGLPTLRTDAGYDVDEMERCDVGISACDALVAQTGSVLVTSRSAGGRALSVLPPHHVVLARREQMVPDLAAAYGVLRSRYGGNFPSLISFITGPSRTGDIERILVLGAHGPKRLTVVCF